MTIRKEPRKANSRTITDRVFIAGLAMLAVIIAWWFLIIIPMLSPMTS